MTKVMKCNCDNQYQDSRYGNGMRVFNMAAQEKWRCTSCGNDSSSNAGKKKK